MSDLIDTLIERIELAAVSQRSQRDYMTRMPEFGPSSNSYAHRDGIARGLDLAIEIIRAAVGEKEETQP